MKIRNLIAGVGAALGINKTPTSPEIKHLKPGKVADSALRRFLMRPRPVGKQRRHVFTSKSMTRGVQAAKEREQRPRRLAFIAASMRQGVEIARARRAAYIARRSAKWKKLVEVELPRQFAQAMQEMGMGDLVGSGVGLGPTPDFSGPHAAGLV